jgi:hypothetical protein
MQLKGAHLVADPSETLEAPRTRSAARIALSYLIPLGVYLCALAWFFVTSSGLWPAALIACAATVILALMHRDAWTVFAWVSLAVLVVDSAVIVVWASLDAPWMEPVLRPVSQNGIAWAATMLFGQWMYTPVILLTALGVDAVRARDRDRASNKRIEQNATS